MKIYFAEGQFGNQLFQLAHLFSERTIGENILAWGFDDLDRVFELSKTKEMGHVRLFPLWTRSFFYRFFSLLSDKKNHQQFFYCSGKN